MPVVAARTGLRRVPWWAWTLAAIALVIGLVAALGGFGTAPITKVPTIALGSTYRGDLVDARVLGAHLTGVSPTGERAPAGSRWLRLDLDDVNRSDAPVPADSISLRTIAGPLDGTTAADRVLSTRGSGAITQLQPGIRTRIVSLWKVPDGALRTGDRVVVGLFESVPRDGPTVLSGAYTDPDVKVRLVFTVGAGS